jgi:hypothetical protein
MYRYTIITILFFLINGSNLYAFWGRDRLPEPFSTTMERKEERDVIDFVGTDYYYTSGLSKQSLLDFYRKKFSQQGYNEFNKDDRGDDKSTFIFKDAKDNNRINVLMFFGKTDDDKTEYVLEIGRSKEYSVDDVLRKAPPEVAEKARALIEQYKIEQVTKVHNAYLFGDMKKPQQVDFMPLFPGAMQFKQSEHKDGRTLVTSYGYLSQADADEVVDFYVRNMAQRGWVLKDRENNSGRYNVEQWISLVAPDTKFNPGCGIVSIPVPLLKLHGSTLTFTSVNKKCLLTVYTFDDAVELSHSHPYNLDAMERHGSTVIGVIYTK